MKTVYVRPKMELTEREARALRSLAHRCRPDDANRILYHDPKGDVRAALRALEKVRRSLGDELQAIANTPAATP